MLGGAAMSFCVVVAASVAAGFTSGGFAGQSKKRKETHSGFTTTAVPWLSLHAGARRTEKAPRASKTGGQISQGWELDRLFYTLQKITSSQ